MGGEIQVRRPAGSVSLPDTHGWTDRFQIRSASSDNLYTVARNVKSGKWGCSCPGYIRHRHCKHLTEGCGLSLSQIHGRDHLDAPKTRKGLGGGKEKKF